MAPATLRANLALPLIAPQYTTDNSGTYPTANWQPTGNQNVLNHQGIKTVVHNGTAKRVGMGTLLIAQILILSMAVQETKPIMPSENMLEKQQHQGF